MRPLDRSVLALAALAALAAAASGCSLAYGYPASGPEICGNDVDDDLDGLVDCADTCQGSCPEDVALACHDGRDDDRDGLTDFADPSCWPLADVTLESCASTPPTHAVFDFDGGDESWAADAGDLGADPAGMEGTVVVAHDAAHEVDAREVHLLTGRTVGTRASMRVTLDPTRDHAALVLDVQDGVLLVDRVRATFGTSMFASNTLIAEAQTIDQQMLGALPRGTYVVSLEVVDDATVRVAVASGGAEVASLTTAIPPNGWSDAQAFAVRLEVGTDGTAPVVVDEVTVDRDPLTHCGDAEVVPRVGSAIAGVTPRALVALGDGSHCLLGSTVYDETGSPRLPATPALSDTTDRGHVFVVRAQDDLWRFGIGRTRDLLGGSLVDGRVHTLLWDGLGDSRLASTSDCATTELAEPIPAGADLEIRGYGVVGTTHEIYAIDHGQIVVRTFSAGDASFETVAVAPVDDTATIGVITRIGADLVVRRDTVPPTFSVVSTGARTEGVGDVLRAFLTVRASGRAGACDEYRTTEPVLAIDPSPRAADADATGIVLVDCVGRETHESSILGIVPHEMVVHAR